jgi:hypothetical protein
MDTTVALVLKNAIPYRILYHFTGYIRLEIPSLKKLSSFFMFKNLKTYPAFPIPDAIKAFHVDTLNANIIIQYEPEKIDILDYINNLALDSATKKS